MENDQAPADLLLDAMNVVVVAEEEGEESGGNAVARTPTPPPGDSSSTGEFLKQSSETVSAFEQLLRKNKKRKLSHEYEGVFEICTITDAIHQFREAYVEIETSKLESMKNAITRETTMVTMTVEAEERRCKNLMETQLAVAQIIADGVKVALEKCLVPKGA